MRNNTELYLFIFRRGNDFCGYKLNPDGSIIWTKRGDTEYIDTVELPIEYKSNNEFMDSYDVLATQFTDGNVVKIETFIDDDGAYNKKVSKVMDINFCNKTAEHLYNGE